MYLCIYNNTITLEFIEMIKKTERVVENFLHTILKGSTINK